MAEQAEVGIKLVVDDAASKVTQTLKANFNDLGTVVGRVKSQFSEIATVSIGTAIGQNLVPALHKVWDIASEFVDVAMDSQEQVRKLGMYYVTGSEMSWNEAMVNAKRVNDELTKTAIGVGMEVGEARQAFMNMAETSKGTAEALDAVLERTGQLAKIADVASLPLTAMTAEYSMMERGQLRVRGHLAKMLFQQGVFGDSIRTAPKLWAKLSEAQRKAKLEEGMQKLNKKLEEAPESMASLISSFRQVKHRLMDIAGTKLVEYLTPRIQKVLATLEAQRPRLEALAGKFGDFLVTNMERAFQWGGTQLDYLAGHWDEIQAGIKDGAQKVKGVIAFMIQHKNAIASMWVAQQVAPLAQTTLLALPQFALLYKHVATLAGPLGFAGVVAASAPLIIAFAGFAMTIYGVKKALDDLAEIGTFGEALDIFKARNRPGVVQEADMSAISEAIAADIKQGNVISASKRVAAARDVVDRHKAAIARGRAEQPQVEGETLPLAMEYEQTGIAAMDAMLDKFSQTLPAASNITFMEGIATQNAMVVAYNESLQRGDQQMATLIANLAGKSEAMAYGLQDSSVKIEGGFDAFAARLDENTRKFVEKMGEQYKMAHGGVKEKDTKATVNMNMPGATINIKQEFRDADPDRIALYFREDLIAAATSRTRSRVRTPFGL